MMAVHDSAYTRKKKKIMAASDQHKRDLKF